jgi:hypothetical protein
MGTYLPSTGSNPVVMVRPCRSRRTCRNFEVGPSLLDFSGAWFTEKGVSVAVRELVARIVQGIKARGCP